jgi:charged multivesicular body protein 7
MRYVSVTFLEHHAYCPQVIKFVDATSGTPEITAVDHGVLELKTAVANLSIQIDHITVKIDS